MFWSVPEIPEQGHFGLAVQDYTHSTAPNRRFADLVTQRLIKAQLAGQASSLLRRRTGGHRQQLHGERKMPPARWSGKCRNGIAAVAMSRRIGETFDAIVTGVTPRGTFVRVLTAARRRLAAPEPRSRRGRQVAGQADADRCPARVHRLRSREPCLQVTRLAPLMPTSLMRLRVRAL